MYSTTLMEEPRKLFREDYEESQQVYDVERAGMLATKFNLAVKLCKLGEWKMAEGLSIRVLQESEKVLGLDHPRSLAIRTAMERLLCKIEKQRQAMERNRQLNEAEFKRLISLGKSGKPEARGLPDIILTTKSPQLAPGDHVHLEKAMVRDPALIQTLSDKGASLMSAVNIFRGKPSAIAQAIRQDPERAPIIATDARLSNSTSNFGTYFYGAIGATVGSATVGIGVYNARSARQAASAATQSAEAATRSAAAAERSAAATERNVEIAVAKLNFDKEEAGKKEKNETGGHDDCDDRSESSFGSSSDKPTIAPHHEHLCNPLVGTIGREASNLSLKQIKEDNKSSIVDQCFAQTIALRKSSGQAAPSRPQVQGLMSSNLHPRNKNKAEAQRKLDNVLKFQKSCGRKDSREPLSSSISNLSRTTATIQSEQSLEGRLQLLRNSPHWNNHGKFRTPETDASTANRSQNDDDLIYLSEPPVPANSNHGTAKSFNEELDDIFRSWHSIQEFDNEDSPLPKVLPWGMNPLDIELERIAGGQSPSSTGGFTWKDV